MKKFGKPFYLSVAEMAAFRRVFIRANKMSDFPEPTPEEVAAYNKIYPGTPEYNKHQRQIRLRQRSWACISTMALVMGGMLLAVAIMLITGAIG